ncbi:MAG: aspartate aminotransferase family protein, partial [Alphaproteobacteria bacterium]|nr:aspartate aminotransferase family protein [Alphaproteobacteria bacterium]
MTPSKPFPVLMPVYDRADLWFESGEGVWLYDEKGERYLDFVGGVAVTSLGHANPRLAKTVKEQAEKLWTVSNIFHTRLAERLAQRLVDLSFADTVFFQNSGVEAWECGIKVIRKYFSAIGQPQRFRVITFEGCFHGRSMTAIAASKAEKMVKGFGPLIDGFDQVKWGDIGALRAAITDQTAAICIEPVQGEGGVRPASPAFLQALRALCDEKGLLLYYDEIQCGLGRTGKMFAYEHSGVAPDVMCIAKALGNGYPIGVCMATAKAAQGMTTGTHGSTFGGNPLAAAVGNAVLDIMTEPGFLESVARKGDYLGAKLDDAVKRYPKVFAERRGAGLLQGLRCVLPFADVAAALRD